MELRQLLTSRNNFHPEVGEITKYKSSALQTLNFGIHSLYVSAGKTNTNIVPGPSLSPIQSAKLRIFLAYGFKSRSSFFCQLFLWFQDAPFTSLQFLTLFHCFNRAASHHINDHHLIVISSPYVSLMTMMNTLTDVKTCLTLKDLEAFDEVFRKSGSLIPSMQRERR